MNEETVGVEACISIGSPITKNGEVLTHIDDLSEGDKIVVGTLFGRREVIVKDKGVGGYANAYTEDGNLGAILNFDEDTQKWVCSTSFNPKALTKINLV